MIELKENLTENRNQCNSGVKIFLWILVVHRRF